MKIAPTTYSRLQIALHWFVVVGVVLQIALHEFIVTTRASLARGEAVSSFDTGMASFHIITGLLIGLAVLVRLVLRWYRGVPPHPVGKSPLANRLADLMHFGLYAALLAMVLTGLATAAGIPNLAGIHLAINLVMVAMILGHTAAAFWGQLVRRDGTLRRMMSSRPRA
jgi:cytochrome b561